MEFILNMVVSSLIGLIGYWIGKRFLPQVDEISEEEKDRMTKKFRKANWGSRIAWVILTPLFWVLVPKGFMFIYCLRFDPLLVHQIAPDVFTFGILLLPIGVVLPALPISLFLKWRMTNDDYREFEYYCNHCFSNVRGDVSMKIALWICIPLPLWLALLSLDWNVRFEEDRMVHNTFWGFGAEEYPYSDIIDIQHHLSNTTPIGVVTDFPHNEIHFKDGYIYTMDECFMDVVNEDTELELITYVSEQSGIPISTIAQRELAP